MTYAQRPVTPVSGLMIYQTDVSPGFYYYDGTTWQRVGLSLNDYWLLNGSDIYYLAGKVSIGTTTADGNGLNVTNYITNKGAIHGLDINSGTTYAEGYLGFLTPTMTGIPMSVYHIGVFGVVSNGNNGAGVYGWNSNRVRFNYGGIFAANGNTVALGSMYNNYGIYSIADSGYTNIGTYTRGIAGYTNYGLMSVAQGGTTNYSAYLKGRVYIESHASSTDAADYTSSLLYSKVIHTQSYDTKAIEAYSVPQPGYGEGVHATGGSYGVYALVPSSNYSGSTYGLYSDADGTAGTRYGVYGTSLGMGTGTHYGLYGNASGATTNYGLYAVGTGSATNYGVFAAAQMGTTNYAGYLTGRLYVQGNSSIAYGGDYTSSLITAQVTHTQQVNTNAVEAYSVPQPGFGTGVYGTGGSYGVYGIVPTSSYSGISYGVMGSAAGTAGTRYGVYGTSTGSGTGTRIGIYGNASGGATNWAGYLDGSAYIASDLRINTTTQATGCNLSINGSTYISDNLEINTTTQATGYALSVNGKIACTEVLVQNPSNWPDYVFSDSYHLTDLGDVEKTIRQEKHLPGIPSAAEIETGGIQVGDMQKRLLEKIEELTLHLIRQGKEIESLKQEIEQMKTANNSSGKEQSK
jgi:hypothetical protein